MALCFSAVSFAAPVNSSVFPFGVEFDLDVCRRICYAGHPDGTVIYKEGIAVTPESNFRVVPKLEDTPSVSDLSITVSLVYENDSLSGSHREILKEYAAGDLHLGDSYRFLSDNTAASLEERARLYSDSLSGVELTLSSKGKDARKKTFYLYVCTDDDYFDYLINAERSYGPDMTEDDPEEQEEVIAEIFR